MAQANLISAYNEFMQTADAYINISCEESYHAALVQIEALLEEASDTTDDPLNPLIDLLSQGIENYESQDEGLMNFIAEAESTPSDIALLRSLMASHQLTGSDLPEIGDKTMVSKVLNGKRVLQRGAIEALAERFGIRSAVFLGG